MPPAFRNHLVPTGCDTPAPAQHLRCSAPWRLRARILSVRRAPRRAAVLVKVMAPVQTAPIAAFECSSQPPTSECCDDRLNPPGEQLFESRFLVFAKGAAGTSEGHSSTTPQLR